LQWSKFPGVVWADAPQTQIQAAHNLTALVNRPIISCMKRLCFIATILAFAVLLTLFRSLRVSAQTAATTSPTTGTVISDFAKDVQEGKQTTLNDVEVQNNQKDAKENEDVNAKEANQEGVNEVGPKENIENDENKENANNLNAESGNKNGGNDNSSGSSKEQTGSSGNQTGEGMGSESQDSGNQ